IGGGMPVGAFGGRRDIMQHIAPLGAVYQAGTLSGNPVAMAAGLASLKIIQQENFYALLEKRMEKLLSDLKEIAAKNNIDLFTQHAGSMFGIFFTDQKSINSFADVKQCNIPRFKKFFNLMIEQGVYFAPSAFEAGFMSSMHGDKE